MSGGRVKKKFLLVMDSLKHLKKKKKKEKKKEMHIARTVKA